MRMFFRPACAAVLACTLLAAPVFAAGHYPEKDHQPVAFADMEFTGFDETRLNSALSRLKDLDDSGALEKKNAETRREVQTLYEEIMDELDILSTQNALAGIQYDANGADPAMADASAEIAAQGARLSDETLQVLQRLTGTPYEDILEADAGKDNVAALRDYEPLTDKQADLLDKEQRLIQKYDQAMARPAEVVYEGEIWTEETLAAADVEEDVYFEVTDLLDQARNRIAGEIYRELVQVRTEIAREAGYENYAEYAYENTYNRDYSIKDIQSVWEAVKNHVVPISEKPLDDLTSRDIRNLEMRSRSSGEEILDAMDAFLYQTDQELGETLRFMRKYHLYDIEYSDAKLPTGYTVGLPAYGTAFIFNSPYGDYQDYSDTVHEFGHFCETFHSTEREFWADFNIDVGEIHSQALELFFTSYAENVFASCGETYRSIILYNILDSVLEGCMYDEFQVAVYENPDQSLNEINDRFRDISEQYGYEYGADDFSGFWVEISHTFQSPMYYISYATSALSALDLWLWYLEDEPAAVETYMELSALSLSLPYREAVKEAGLRDIFKPDTIPALAEELTAYLDGEPVHRQNPGKLESLWLLVPAAGLAVAFVLPYTAIRRRRERARAKTVEEPWEL